MSNNQVHIREATSADRDAIREVTLAAYAQYATRMPHWNMYQEHLHATLAEDGPATRLVAEQNGSIVGSVLLYPANSEVYETASANAGWPEIRLLAVAPAARGQGIAKALLGACIARARHSGARTLGLHTEDLMEAAVSMYTRRGFVRAPEYDFVPYEGVHVKGYRLSLNDREPPTTS